MLGTPVHLARRSLQGLWELQHRERMRLLGEMSQMRGLM